MTTPEAKIARLEVGLEHLEDAVKESSRASHEVERLANERTLQLSELKTQVTSVDRRLDDHLQHVRQTLHGINSHLQEIKNQLFVGDGRMEKIESALDTHMKHEEDALIKISEKCESCEVRLTALDHPKEGRLVEIEEVTKGIHAVHRTAKIVGYIATFVATLAGAWAAVKHWGTA